MTRQTRRDFLTTTAAGAASAWWVGNSFAEKVSKNINERIAFGCIGAAGKGSSDTDSAGRAGEVVALCDIDNDRMRPKANRYKGALTFNDYRKMLEGKMGKKIDAITVSTPDHSHAPASSMGLKLKKHVFCQKPMTWSVGEARTLRQLAEKNKLCTQMGNQGTADSTLRQSVDVIRAGYFGKITEVHVWTNRPIWPQGVGRPKETPPVPGNLNWDLFVGPAPMRPYHPAYHPFKWRGWLDFGTGALGDMACHTMNMPVMALELFDPISIEVVKTTGIVANETYPKSTVLKYEFAKNKNRGPITMYWYDGGEKPSKSLLEGKIVKGKNANMRNSGCIVVGDEGRLYSGHDYGGAAVYIGEKLEGKKIPERKLPKSPGHFREFANAIAKNDPKLAMSNFSYAGPLTETVVVGNLALRLNRKIEWDAKNLKVKGVSEADSLIYREYRKGWTL